MNVLEKFLIGNTILCISLIEDYIQIETDDLYISIYNPIKITNKQGKLIYDNSENREVKEDILWIAEEVKNKKIVKTKYVKNDYLYIKLKNKLNIYILLKEELYSGPEAIVIDSKRTGHIIVVQ